MAPRSIPSRQKTTYEKAKSEIDAITPAHRVYLKVWRFEINQFKHHGFWFFEVGSSQERIVYKQATDVMEQHPCANWAVSMPCERELAGVPVICDSRRLGLLSVFKTEIRPQPTTVLTLLSKNIAGKSLDLEALRQLGVLGLAVEAFPGEWSITKMGFEAIRALGAEAA